MVTDREKRRERMERRMRLIKILQAILSGKIDSKHAPVSQLVNGRTIPRAEYVSPGDRSQYNYGYMEIGERL